MPNRILSELNYILDSAESIRDFYSRRYLTSISRDYLPHDTVRTELDEIDMYYRISGYNLYENKEDNAAKILEVSKEILGVAGVSGTPLAYSIYNDGHNLKVYYGTNHEVAPQIRNALKGNVFSAEVKNEWIHPRDLEEVQQENGILMGLSTLSVGDLDFVINCLIKEKYMVNFLLIPVSQSHISNDIMILDQYLDAFQRVSRQNITTGSNRVRNFENDNHEVLDVIDLLTKEKKRMQLGQLGGLWKASVHLSAANRDVFDRLAQVLTAKFRGKSNLDIDSSLVTVVRTTRPVVKRSTWSVPESFLGKVQWGGLHGDSLTSISDLSQAASVIAFPIHSHPGYQVGHLGESVSSTGAFDRFSKGPEMDVGVFRFGTMDQEARFDMSLESFRQHAFVTGSSQYGKSTSVKKVLWEAHERGIQFLVIESAKKEYWKLVNTNHMNQVKVYSVGKDALDFSFNPFQPEGNTILDTHIQNIQQAFLSLFDDVDPLPQILTELIYHCYERKGWNPEDRVREKEDREYPLLEDLLLHLEEVVDGIGYSEEIRRNMTGMIRIRITSLIRQAGKCINTLDNLSIGEMYKDSCVIELDDFSDQNKPFMAALLAIKVHEYSRQFDTGNRLKRLLVIEEAHHVIPNPEHKSVTRNAGLSSKYFSNLLAEVSTYGTGVIIIDQRPSAIAGSALANTGVKIVHNLKEGEDLSSMARSLALREEEAALLNRMETGEAIVIMPQRNERCRVRVDGILEETHKPNFAYIFTDSTEDELDSLITPFERDFIHAHGYHAMSIQSCVTFIEMRNRMNFTKIQKIIMAGFLAEGSQESEMMKRQNLYEWIHSF